jgi:hypothetical protein
MIIFNSRAHFQAIRAGGATIGVHHRANSFFDEIDQANSVLGTNVRARAAAKAEALLDNLPDVMNRRHGLFKPQKLNDFREKNDGKMAVSAMISRPIH